MLIAEENRKINGKPIHYLSRHELIETVAWLTTANKRLETEIDRLSSSVNTFMRQLAVTRLYMPQDWERWKT